MPCSFAFSWPMAAMTASAPRPSVSSFTRATGSVVDASISSSAPIRLGPREPPRVDLADDHPRAVLLRRDDVHEAHHAGAQDDDVLADVQVEHPRRVEGAATAARRARPGRTGRRRPGRPRPPGATCTRRTRRGPTRRRTAPPPRSAACRPGPGRSGTSGTSRTRTGRATTRSPSSQLGGHALARRRRSRRPTRGRRRTGTCCAGRRCTSAAPRCRSRSRGAGRGSRRASARGRRTRAARCP